MKILDREISWILKEKYGSRTCEDFKNDIKRLKRGEPIDYIIGFTKFLGCKIDLFQKPLIPRPETEYWVEKVIEEIKVSVKTTLSRNFYGEKIKVLDLFSGSGCVGLAILKNTENTKVVFAEKDKKLLKQIKINLELNKIDSKRYRIIQSDVFQQVDGKYDYVLANPPYIAEKRKNKIQKSVLKFEPKKALFGGKNGLFFIKIFLEGAKNHFKKENKIYMEFDSRQKEEIRKMLKKNGYKNYQFQKDQFKRWRYLIIN